MSNKIRLNITLSKELDEALTAMANESGVAKGEVFRQAIALLKEAHNAKKNQKLDLALTRDGKTVDTKIVGLI